jgi:alpha-galactosidase
MKKANIVFIGAGSMSFGIPMLKDLFTEPALAGAMLSLVDIDTETLSVCMGLR